MNKIENINLLPDTEPDSGDYTGEDGLLYCVFYNKNQPAGYTISLLSDRIYNPQQWLFFHQP